ncbi:MAG: DUF3972 domain-containing protein [Candidatus Omnitrophica bacterium]|nr:DUF3972 domain-containing protein [Candidatus Omnitrophota bacterium]
MTNEIIFFTQIASIASFIIALFILYRILVSQKDATIELLKEKNTFLKDKIALIQETAPDALAETLSNRIHLLQEELDRLSKDQVNNKEIIQKKEKELQNTQEDFKKLKEQLEEIQNMASEYFCPHCKAPMVSRAYHDEVTEYGDVDHEFIDFECGYTIIDGKEERPCKYKKNS